MITIDQALSDYSLFCSTPVELPKDARRVNNLQQTFKAVNIEHYGLIKSAQNSLFKNSQLLFLKGERWPIAYAIADKLKLDSYIYVHFEQDKPCLMVIMYQLRIVDIFTAEHFALEDNSIISNKGIDEENTSDDDLSEEQLRQKHIRNLQQLHIRNLLKDVNPDISIISNKELNEAYLRASCLDEYHIKHTVNASVIDDICHSSVLSKYKSKVSPTSELTKTVKDASNFKYLLAIATLFLIGGSFISYKFAFAEKEIRTEIIDEHKDLRDAFTDSTNFKSQVLPFYADMNELVKLKGWSVTEMKLTNVKGKRLVSYKVKRANGITQNLQKFASQHHFKIEVNQGDYYLLAENKNMPVFDSPGLMSIDAIKNYIFDATQVYWPDSAKVSSKAIKKAKKWQPTPLQITVINWSVEDFDSLASTLSTVPASFVSADLTSNEFHMISGQLNFNLLGI